MTTTTWDRPDVTIVMDAGNRLWRRDNYDEWWLLRGIMGRPSQSAAEVEKQYGPCVPMAPVVAALAERRDVIPSVDDIALGLAYADGAHVNIVTVALRLDRARELHEHALAVLGDMWALVDAARNRP